MNLPAPSLKPPAPPLHVAGVGASAGGLEAMLPMFAQMRPTGRIAYVVAQHMAHNGHSELVVRLINRESALPVVLAQQGDRLQADTVYVIPAGRDGVVNGTILSLQEPAPDNLSTPSVNALLSSIAASGQHHGIGIVLSGTGSDGVAGCRAIKAGGGLTIAQEPADAKFDGMPKAVIDAGLADRVLAAESVGSVLAELFPGTGAAPPAQAPAATPVPAVGPGGNAAAAAGHAELIPLLQLVHQATGIDFSSYKEDTLQRRLEKRKSLLGIASADAYLALIRRQPEELQTLQRLFLVSVSSFFRDRASFRALERALAATVAAKADGEPIRIWVPGCASGEEPYSLAIMLAELLGEYRRRHPVRIIGTDLNAQALDMARAGIYRQTACREMEEGLRDRYFIPRGHHFEVCPELRAMVDFEQRDVLTGPPERNLDLISCRNFLIYLKSHLQEQLIAGFHQALVPQGLLFIGEAESLGSAGNSLFTPDDHYHRVFRRRT